MPKCKDCNKNYGFLELTNGRCKSCINLETPPCNRCHNNFPAEELKQGYCTTCYPIEVKRRQEKKEEQAAMHLKMKKSAEKELAIKNIVLTTETVVDFKIEKRLEIVTAECALGMNVFRDLFAGVRDIVGGRSGGTQKILKDAKNMVLKELRLQAYEMGANAVVAIDLDYSEFSGGGKSMLFVVASGTAVKASL